MTAESTADRTSIQAVVDALSVAVGRPVLLDDAALAPIAFSRQWDIDDVRSSSILERGPQPQVRESLFAQGIAAADDVVHLAADPVLGMSARVCMPVRRRDRLLGYIWILDPRSDLGESDLDSLRRAARETGALLVARPDRDVPDDTPLLTALISAVPEDREAAVREARKRSLLLEEPVVLCVLAPSPESEEEPIVAAHRAVRRLSVGHAIAAVIEDRAIVVASLADPVLRMLAPDEVGDWVRAVAGFDLLVGQSAPLPLQRLDEASRQANISVSAARAEPAAGPRAWSTLGADRLLAQFPGHAYADLPERLVQFLGTEPALVATLATFLDRAGDVKSAAEALCLHRSGLYYRLRRISELTGLDLDDGDDLLLAHLAVRLHGRSAAAK